MRGGEKKKLVAKKSNESKGKNLLLSSSRLYERIVHKNTYATNSYVIRVEQRNEVAIACEGREGGRGAHKREPERLSSTCVSSSSYYVART